MDALEAEGYRCRAYLVDISERERVYEAAKKVKQEVGNVQVLINNAGIVACRTLWDLSDKAIESTYAVNILSHYWVSISCGGWPITQSSLHATNGFFPF